MGVVLGVDGRRGGWAVAVAHVGARRCRRVAWHAVAGQHAAGFRDVLDLAERIGAQAVGLDVPVGLPSHDWRPADLAAKRLLGRASARVFLAPPREVLAAPDYGSARAVARQVLGGKGVSAQTYGLSRVVLAVDDVLRSGDHPAGSRVVEVHPELSFMALAGSTQPLASKKTDEGRQARLVALASWLGPAAGGALADAPDGDDHLDALAAAWSAWRWDAGAAQVLGGQVDDYGLPMRIVT